MLEILSIYTYILPLSNISLCEDFQMHSKKIALWLNKRSHLDMVHVAITQPKDIKSKYYEWILFSLFFPNYVINWIRV